MSKQNQKVAIQNMEAKLTKQDKQLRTPIQNKDDNHVNVKSP